MTGPILQNGSEGQQAGNKNAVRADPASIVVLAREHIGDLVCTTPALRGLRKRFPKAHIAVEVGERAACVLESNPSVDEIIIRRDHQGAKGKLGFIRLMRNRRFDMAVILDDCTDMPLTVWLGGARERVGLARKKRFAGLLTTQVPYDFNAHEMIDNFCNVAASLGADTSNKRPEVFPSEGDESSVNQCFESAGLSPGQTIIGLNPGASAPSNRWPANRFEELVQILTRDSDIRVVLFGGKQDAEAADTIARDRPENLTVFTGKFRVLELAAALRRCDLLITGDTGPMHLACAVGTPVLGLFGPAVPQESGPGYVPGNRVIRKVESCPSCTKYVCSQNQRCMLAITAEEVAAAAWEMLGSIARRSQV